MGKAVFLCFKYFVDMLKFIGYLFLKNRHFFEAISSLQMFSKDFIHMKFISIGQCLSLERRKSIPVPLNLVNLIISTESG